MPGRPAPSGGRPVGFSGGGRASWSGGGYQNRAVYPPQPQARAPSPSRGSRQPRPSYGPGRPARFPPGFVPSSKIPTAQRQQSAKEAFWKARGYSTVQLESGLKVRLPQADAQAMRRFERTRSRLSVTVPSARFVDPRINRLSDAKPLSEVRGFWRKAGVIVGAALKENLSQNWHPHR